MRHGESLVQIEVADVGPDVSRVGQSYLRVHVGAVHVYLTARVVHGVDDLADAALEYSVRRGVGDHESAQLAAVLLGLLLQILHVDVAVGVACHGDDLHARHRRRSGVGAVSRRGDEYHVAVTLTAALVVGADHHKTRVLARRARVGLQRASREARDDGQIALQLGDQFGIALRLVGGGEGVHVLESCQRQRLHERRGVEFHGARSERYHRIGERYVAQLQPLDVTHHVGLRVVLVEDGFGEYGRTARHGGRERRLGGDLHRLGLASLGLGEYADHLGHLLGRGHLVEREAHFTLRGVEEVDAARQGYVLYYGGFGLYLYGVEYVARGELVAHRLQRVGCGCGRRVSRHGGAAQTLGTVVYAVESRHRGHQGRGGADVRGGALALDVLLAHLESHAQRAVAEAVHRDAYDASGHVALEHLAGGHVACRGASEAHRASQTLRRADGYVGAPLRGRREQREREDVGHGRQQCSGLVSTSRESGVIAHLAVSGGVLHDGSELVARELVGVVIVDYELYAERLAASQKHVERLREYLFVDEESVAALLHRLARTQGEHHEHRFGRGGGLVQERAVGYLHARE